MNLGHRLALVLVTMAGFLSTACIQPASSSQPAPPTKPMTNGAVAHDEARRAVLLVTYPLGPQTGLMQTWTWDGRGWARKAPLTSPPARPGGLLAYDASRQRTVLFGGLDRSGPLTDTWEWDGSNWLRRQPAHSPDSTQETGSMAYDPATRRILLYQWERQTWSWDGTDWTRLQPAHLPGPLYGTVVSDGKHVVLTGGSFDGNSTETWAWDRDDWSRVAAIRVPDLSFLPAAFDQATHEVIAFGGGPGDDTWRWDGMKWSRAHPRHSPTGELHRLVYDGKSKGILGFTGTDGGVMEGVYQWDGSDWSAVAGSRPTIAAGSGLLPTTDAAGRIRRTLTKTSPILLPQLSAGLDQAEVTVDSTGFSWRAMNDDRSIRVMIGIGVPGNSNLGADNKTIAFRRSSAYYQYIASDPRAGDLCGGSSGRAPGPVRL